MQNLTNVDRLTIPRRGDYHGDMNEDNASTNDEDFATNHTELLLSLARELQSIDDYGLDWSETWTLEELLDGVSPVDAVNKAYGDYRPNADGYQLDAYGNLKSVDRRDLLDMAVDYADDVRAALIEQGDRIFDVLRDGSLSDRGDAVEYAHWLQDGGFDLPVKTAVEEWEAYSPNA